MRERRDRDDVPAEELTDFSVWCRNRDVVPTPHRLGVILSEAEWERWHTDPVVEGRRRHDEYPRWLAARVAWAGQRGGWPVIEWELCGTFGRKREQPGAPRPSQMPPCPQGRKPWPRP